MHVQWSMNDILALDHRDRRHWVTVIQHAKQQVQQQVQQQINGDEP